MAHFDQKILYDAHLPVYTGSDFGLDTLAFIACNIDFRTGRILIFDAFQRVNWDLLSFYGLVVGKPVYENNWQYNDEDWKQIEKSRLYKYTDHFGDPYNVDNRSVISNGDTIRSQLRKLGIEMLTNRKSTVEERIRKVQQRMADIYIDKDLFELITAIQQSRYPQRPENSNTSTSQTKPIHNEFSHFRTALEYLIDNLPSVSPNLNMTSNSIIVPRIVGMDLF